MSVGDIRNRFVPDFADAQFGLGLQISKEQRALYAAAAGRTLNRHRHVRVLGRESVGEAGNEVLDIPQPVEPRRSCHVRCQDDVGERQQLVIGTAGLLI